MPGNGSVHLPTDAELKMNSAAPRLSDRIPPPEGFQRIYHEKLFASFLRTLTLHPHGHLVHLFNGHIKPYQEGQVAVLKMDTGERDLQQCADAVMRIRAEYLYHQKKYEAIHFNFTNGFKADYKRWRRGESIAVKGTSCQWIPSSKANDTYSSFRQYLDIVFAYAGSLSLSKELKPVNELNHIQPGDVFIRGGAPGHAAMVMDVAQHPVTHEIVFLLAQSYMPAQEIHILANLNDASISPWYAVRDINETLETPEYTFSRNELMRFEDE